MGAFLTGDFLITAGAAEPTTLQFAGLEWAAKHGPDMGPGPNMWDRRNVWVDDQGRLHLTISLRDGKWTCAEVSTTQRLHFGTYDFQTIGRLDQFDANVVLGLFNYPPRDVGPDTTHEIDIEFARWGHADAPVGNFTVWPAKDELKQTSHTFDVRLNSSVTTHRFDWQRDRITFASMHGQPGDSEQPISRWLFDRRPVADHISTAPMPLHLNLWLFQGRAPTDGKEVEVIIKSFSYRPLDPPKQP
jgi:hypothetical protein